MTRFQRPPPPFPPPELAGADRIYRISSDGRLEGDKSDPENRLRSLFADDRFRVVPETMVDGLIVIDSVGVIRYVNPACLKLFLHESEETLIGQNVSTLMPKANAQAHDAYLARHRETRVKRRVTSHDGSS